MNVYTTIAGIQYGPLAVTQASLVHRVGLIRVEMADGSIPTAQTYLSPTTTQTVELFPRTIGYWSLQVAP
ncbi:hypothetical protein BH683_007740 [Williamsia sp. 1138]|uniref:hypothetical protein n=1 Tax=Williamsia sp. 1138 TaxID=1903117 RepID=UPI000A0F7F16|nr:hypothetical protein [Williamsia sp. 1138]OZG29809.1 hypothetical protein BH683_007740 [Williamsia sp. 1138]